jgi:DNA-binding transcriptional LysR family regulator
MDTTSLYYFKELTKDLNVTHTAKRLYLSQQTLSNHIARLEKWCGTPLFYRKPRLSLTPAGRYLLQFAEHTLQEEQQMKDTISDINEEQQGTIRFGASYARYCTLLPQILPVFSEKYPNVTIDITDDNAAPLITKMLSGDLDIILSPRKDILPTLDSTLLMATTVYLCVADSLLTKYYGEKAQSLKEKSLHGANLVDFAKLPFYIITPPNSLGSRVAACFEEANFIPRIYMQVHTLRMSGIIASTRLAATFNTTIPLDTEIQSMPPDINIFPLKSHNEIVRHNVYLTHYKNRYIPRYIEYFRYLIIEYYKQHKDVDLTRIV